MMPMWRGRREKGFGGSRTTRTLAKAGRPVLNVSCSASHQWPVRGPKLPVRLASRHHTDAKVRVNAMRASDSPFRPSRAASTEGAVVSPERAPVHKETENESVVSKPVGSPGVGRAWAAGGGRAAGGSGGSGVD